MTNLKNVDNVSNIVEIGNNHIKYYNETLKISNISRTWIFRFQNVEKKKFEEEKIAYANAKSRYEASEIRKKNETVRNILIATAVSLIFSLVCFSFKAAAGAVMFLCLTGVLAYIAYRVYKRNTAYPYSPPLERPFPDKFGLGIEMNSGYRTIFTAIGDTGVRALRKLQNDIDDADVHKETTVFNMNDYNITVENNDGIISTGDNAENIISKERQDDHEFND
ncbi:MAG: hypothetical protein J1F01_02425 [Oscillospiraceae bacterium]|nr:hypothetical protein [Oscillospiraceae bacterium]